MDPNQARKQSRYNTIIPRKKNPPAPRSRQDRILAGMTPIAENSAMVGAAKSRRNICQCFARRKTLAIAFTFPPNAFLGRLLPHCTRVYIMLPRNFLWIRSQVAKPEKSYKRECQETFFSVGSVPTLFCLGIQPNCLNVVSYSESGLLQAKGFALSPRARRRCDCSPVWFHFAVCDGAIVF